MLRPIKSLAAFKRALALPGATLTLREWRVTDEWRVADEWRNCQNRPRRVVKLTPSYGVVLSTDGLTSRPFIPFGKAASWTFHTDAGGRNFANRFDERRHATLVYEIGVSP